ncbi:MAG TPA: metallophosphoesterase [Candidatus Limnocylindrales bacterium]|nr:metallophosphoesterase [Candidatus Limnocylindrales bacterium]
MAIFALGDLHLSHGGSKPMDIFGPEWENHAQKIALNWNSVVSNNDMVIVNGDISWAMYLSEAAPDLAWLANLNGTKLLIRGNHDYWWSSVGKVRAQLPASIHALQNDHFAWQQWVVCGTRGWLCPGEEGFDHAHDQKIYLREAQRLRLSLDSACRQSSAPIIAAFHFPPFNRNGEASAFTRLLEQAGVKICVFGHIHDAGRSFIFQGEREGVCYHFTAADGVGFTPVLVAEC